MDLREKSSGRRQITSLQTVRALAFLGIFISHCGVAEYGAWGVSVFLVLSGFVMTYTYYDRELEDSFKKCLDFSINKIKKMYPLHIVTMLCGLVFVVVALLTNFSIKSLIFTCGKVFLNVTLLQAWIPSAKIYFSLNAVCWYLSVCLFLYAVFPKIIKYVRKMEIKTSIITILLVYVLQIVIGAASQYVGVQNEYIDNFSKWFVYIFPLFRLGDFLIGCCVAIIYIKRMPIINVLTASLCELTTFFLIVVSIYIHEHKIGVMGAEWFRYTMLFTPTSISLVLLFAMQQGILSKVLTCKPLLYCANISMYTFLMHQLVIRCMNMIIKDILSISLNLYIKTFIALVLTIVCAELFKKIELFYKERRLRSKAYVLEQESY